MTNITKIIGTGCHIPEIIVDNYTFLKNKFYEPDGSEITTPPDEIIRKFVEITGIESRRYLDNEFFTSDMATWAAEEAIISTQKTIKDFSPESIDLIIVAHNYGDIHFGGIKQSQVPSISAIVKNKLGIKNADCIPKDVLFGCPGWLDGMIYADTLIKTKQAKTIMVIGAETLSRVCDPHDRDSMIFADGAGATIVQAEKSIEEYGIIAHTTRNHADRADLIYNGASYKKDYEKENHNFIHMKGRSVYGFAVKNVALVVKELIEDTGLELDDINKIIIHQANEKMDYAIGERLYKIYGKTTDDFKNDFPYIMPMIISWLGNSSVATIPTLLDLIMKGKISEHQFKKGEYVVFASVGAGMSINAMIYKF